MSRKGERRKNIGNIKGIYGLLNSELKYIGTEPERTATGYMG